MDSDFEKVLARIKIILAVESDKEVAEAIGMNPSAFNNRKRSGSIPHSYYIDLANKQNIDLNWLYTGIGSIYKDNFSTQTDQNSQSEKSIKDDHDSSNSNITKVIIEHQDTIKRFKNPEKAKQFNEFLVEIEDKDPEGYDELYKEAKVIYKTIKRIKNKNSSEDDNQDKKIS